MHPSPEDVNGAVSREMSSVNRRLFNDTYGCGIVIPCKWLSIGVSR